MYQCGDKKVFLSKSRNLWLEPLTISGLSFNKTRQEWTYEAIKLLISRRPKPQKTALIFSLGYIDIRTTIGYLLTTVAVTDVEVAIQYIYRCFISLDDRLFSRLRALRDSISIYFLSIPLASFDEHYISDKNNHTKKSLDKFARQSSVFLSPHLRGMAAGSCNNLSSDYCNSNSRLSYIYINDLCEAPTHEKVSLLRDEVSTDCNHVTDTKVIRQIYSRILSCL